MERPTLVTTSDSESSTWASTSRAVQSAQGDGLSQSTAGTSSTVAPNTSASRR